MNLFENIYQGKNVLLTGDTGFKGSWMAKWLIDLGANVIGYSLLPNTNPNHFSLLEFSYESHIADIRNYEVFFNVLKSSNPDIIFHLAAQPLVRYSYENPLETYSTNVMGTANVLEAARKYNKALAIVIITTDKCYENLEQVQGYVESDRMGGFDPYSSSKGCGELLVSSFRNSFFNLDYYNIKHQTLVATARAGNVIGGGDWSIDRLIPDIIKGAVEKKMTIIRNPKSTRPWQHVLEPISGYLQLGKYLMQGKKEFAEGWNFGPEENQCLSVEEILLKSKKHWDRINYGIEINRDFHEATLLSLNINKANNKLGWKPKWSNDLAIEKTINWYKNYYENGILNTLSDIKLFSNS